jgi:hypothetical protein
VLEVLFLQYSLNNDDLLKDFLHLNPNSKMIPITEYFLYDDHITFCRIIREGFRKRKTIQQQQQQQQQQQKKKKVKRKDEKRSKLAKGEEQEKEKIEITV